MKTIGIVLSGFLLLPLPSLCQNSVPVKGMASTVGLYVYPRNNQSATQQLTDESTCYSDAKVQTGYDPNATTTAPNTKPDDKKGHPAAKGAAKGAIIAGATGGDMATGARRGAIVGGIRAKRKEKKEDEQAEKKAQSAQTAQQQQMDAFKRSISACLDAHGYSVK
jgi:hypothetical protein